MISAEKLDNWGEKRECQNKTMKLKMKDWCKIELEKWLTTVRKDSNHVIKY